jgi:hypothetical protein
MVVKKAFNQKGGSRVALVQVVVEFVFCFRGGLSNAARVMCVTCVVLKRSAMKDGSFLERMKTCSAQMMICGSVRIDKSGRN